MAETVTSTLFLDEPSVPLLRIKDPKEFVDALRTVVAAAEGAIPYVQTERLYLAVKTVKEALVDG